MHPTRHNTRPRPYHPLPQIGRFLADQARRFYHAVWWVELLQAIIIFGVPIAVFRSSGGTTAQLGAFLDRDIAGFPEPLLQALVVFAILAVLSLLVELGTRRREIRRFNRWYAGHPDQGGRDDLVERVDPAPAAAEPGR